MVTTSYCEVKGKVQEGLRGKSFSVPQTTTGAKVW